jgi:uncharacterized protein YllA (UPF0747 family)
VTLDESVTAALASLAGFLPKTEFSADLHAALGNAYAPGEGMAAAFGRWLESVLGDRGLVVFDASDPAAKPLVGEVFARELEEPGQTARLAADAGEELRRLGYHAQVVPQEHGVALFLLDGGRQPIRVADEGFLAGDTSIPRAALVARARMHPESFSPNVLLRPIVQDTLFPTVAHGPPNELAYHAQLKSVYARFGVPMPLFVPRATATLIDSAGMRFLNRYPLPFERLQQDDEALLNHLLESHLPSSVEQAYQDAAASIEGRMSALIEAVPAIVTSRARARSTLGRLRMICTRCMGRSSMRPSGDETLRRQFQRTRRQVFPDGIPQARHRVRLLLNHRSRACPAAGRRAAADLGRH